MRLTKNGKKVIAASDLLYKGQDELIRARICLPNLQGEFGDVTHSIKCAENAIGKIQEAIKEMQTIKPA